MTSEQRAAKRALRANINAQAKDQESNLIRLDFCEVTSLYCGYTSQGRSMLAKWRGGKIVEYY